MDLKNKAALVTGATSGIGAAVAASLADAGMRLVLTGRREDALRAAAARYPFAVMVQGDIADPEMPNRLIKTALAAYGQLDVVINNAGVMYAGPVETIDPEQISEMVRVNVEAAYRVAYTAVKHFKAMKTGFLINLSSVLGTKVRPTTGAYAGTKYAIEALTEALRMELAQTGVKVSCIEPGIVDTALCDHFENPPKQVFNITHALAPDDVARCIRFILEQPDHVLIPKLMVMPSEQGL